MDLEGVGQPRVVYSVTEGHAWVRSWSRSGWLSIDRLFPDRGRDILAVRLERPEEVLTVAETESYESGSRFSPDGRWIAYVSDETGRPEVYVVPFPELDRRHQISSNGGIYPRWSQVGDELFFFSSGDGGQISVRYSTDEGVFRWGSPTLLFSFSVTGVSPDAQRFLINRSNPDAMIKDIHVVENWFEVLRDLEGGGG